MLNLFHIELPKKGAFTAFSVDLKLYNLGRLANDVGTRRYPSDLGVWIRFICIDSFIYKRKNRMQ